MNRTYVNYPISTREKWGARFVLTVAILVLLGLLVSVPGCNAAQRQEFWDRFDQRSQQLHEASDDLGSAIDRAIARQREIEKEREAEAETEGGP